MNEFRGRDLSKRREHEQALMKTWMRDAQISFVADEVSVEKQVYIDQARAFGRKVGVPLPPQSGLDGEQRAHQSSRRQVGFKRDHCVQKPGLVSVIARLSLIDGRTYGDSPERAYSFDGGAKAGETVAKVGAESKIGDRGIRGGARVGIHSGDQEYVILIANFCSRTFIGLPAVSAWKRLPAL